MELFTIFSIFFFLSIFTIPTAFNSNSNTYQKFYSIDRTIFNDDRLRFNESSSLLISLEFHSIDSAIFKDDRVDIAEHDKRT